MKLYTSNYARNGSHPQAVAISIKPPAWYTGRSYPLLAPVWDIVMGHKNRTITDEQYTSKYLQLLEDRRLDPNKILNDLGDGAIMLCYESPKDFCHRHIVAEWLTDKTGVEVVELVPQPTQNKHVEGLFEF